MFVNSSAFASQVVITSFNSLDVCVCFERCSTLSFEKIGSASGLSTIINVCSLLGVAMCIGGSFELNECIGKDSSCRQPRGDNEAV